MLLNTLCLAFVSAFIIVVVIGHVLLAAAIWPNFFDGLRSRWVRKAPVASVSDAGDAVPSAPKSAISSKEVAA